MATSPGTGTDPAWWQTALALIASIGLMILAGLAVREVYRAILNLEESTRAALITASATVFVAVASVFLTRYFERRAARERAEQEKRIPVYEDFVRDFLQLIGATKPPAERKEVDEEGAFAVIGKFTEKLIIWGSPDVIRTWVDYRYHSWNAENQTPEEQLEMLTKTDDLLLALRRDLGLSNKKLRKLDLLRLWINDLELEEET